ncbi:MAG: pilus assembly PilX N-terminal domain-containing protein [Candidatus Moraniibacteriota bacterium]
MKTVASRASRKGSVLVFSIIILSLMLVSALTVLSASVLQQKSALSTSGSTRSFQSADAGVEQVLYQVYKKSRTTIQEVSNNIVNASCSGGVIASTDGWKIGFYSGINGDVPITDCSTARSQITKIKSQGTASSLTRAMEAGIRPPSCIGTLPSSAAMYTNDDISLSVDAPYVYSGTNTSAPCEFYCSVGVWNGTSCSTSCDLPWGGTIANGDTATAYQAASVSCGSTCTSQTRTCNNGVLSGAYTAQSCSVQACSSCAIPWGGFILSGQTVTAYQAASVSCGSSCSNQIRTCFNGSLSGSYSAQNCSVQVCSCTGSVPSNANMYIGDDSGLVANTAYTYSGSNTSAKCEYSCNSGYGWNGSSCVSATPSVEYLVVAGGGGGGTTFAGGGGAGGLLTNTGYAVSVGSPISVVVGGGGAGDTGVGYGGKASNGGNSSFGSITAIGGGGGAGSGSGVAGGSGGGALAGSYAGEHGGAGISGQGYKGGDNLYVSPGNGGGGGGGGGAGAVGGASSTRNGAAGGVGISSSISGTATYYAGGGGGSCSNNSGYSGGAGGAGGGGAGGGYGAAGTAGAPNTGGGAGGTANFTSVGAAGGSGIVIIRYPNTYPNAVSTTGSPTVTNTGGYKIYKWTTVGTWSITF